MNARNQRQFWNPMLCDKNSVFQFCSNWIFPLKTKQFMQTENVEFHSTDENQSAQKLCKALFPKNIWFTKFSGNEMVGEPWQMQSNKQICTVKVLSIGSKWCCLWFRTGHKQWRCWQPKVLLEVVLLPETPKASRLRQPSRKSTFLVVGTYRVPRVAHILLETRSQNGEWTSPSFRLVKTGRTNLGQTSREPRKKFYRRLARYICRSLFVVDPPLTIFRKNERSPHPRSHTKRKRKKRTVHIRSFSKLQQ